MKEFIESAVRALAEHPDRVRLAELDGEKTLVFEVRCHPDDVGKIVGKGGKTITALRVLATAMAHRTGRRTLIEVVQ
jgi:hypothetical protein